MVSGRIGWGQFLQVLARSGRVPERLQEEHRMRSTCGLRLAMSLFVAAGGAVLAQTVKEEPATTASASAAKGKVVFLAPFGNETAEDQYEPAAAGMGDLVGAFLAEQKNIRVVERQRLGLLLKEQESSLRGLTGEKYAVAAGKILGANTVMTGRLYLADRKLSVTVKALDIESARVIGAADQGCRPEYMIETALQLARMLGKQMELPLPDIDPAKIDASPAVGLHFGKALGCYYAGNMNAAIMHFMRTVDLDPNYTEAHYWSGLSYYRLKENEHAAIDLEKYLKDAPNGKYATKAKEVVAECRKGPAVPRHELRAKEPPSPAGKEGKP